MLSFCLFLAFCPLSLSFSNFLIDLLRASFYPRRLTCFKCTVQWASLCLTRCSPQSKFRTSIIAQRHFHPCLHANTDPLSVSTFLPFLKFLFSWNYTMCSFCVCALNIFLRCIYICQYVIPYCWIVFRYMDIPQFMTLFNITTLFSVLILETPSFTEHLLAEFHIH